MDRAHPRFVFGPSMGSVVSLAERPAQASRLFASFGSLRPAIRIPSRFLGPNPAIAVSPADRERGRRGRAVSWTSAGLRFATVSTRGQAASGESVGSRRTRMLRPKDQRNRNRNRKRNRDRAGLDRGTDTALPSTDRPSADRRGTEFPDPTQ